MVELSPKCPPELTGALARGELIVVVGPGLGREAGLGDLAGLVDALVIDAEATDVEIDGPALQAWARSGRALDSLEVLERRLGARFGRVVERTLTDRTARVPALARALAGLEGELRAVYTSGTDRLLERAFADAWPSFSTARPDIARRRGLIFKLCGTLEFADTWVVTQAAFEREFGVRSLRRALLIAAYRAHCLLFVGFRPGEELDDRLLALFDGCGDQGQLPSHFVCLPRCGLDARSLLERRGLHVVLGESVTLLRALSPSAARERDVDPSLPPCPYPGLAAFGAGLAAVFHGRSAEISQAASRLGGSPERHRRWLAIEGSSGVGKSSFVHAGLVPALGQGFAEGTPTRWRVATMRPGPHPFRALAGALAEALRPSEVHSREHAIEGLGQRIMAEQSAVTNLTQFVAELAPASAGLLVVVDQLEELVSISAPDERDRFAACLGRLLDRGLIYLITTMRGDFGALLPRAVPRLARLLNEGAARYTLAPISRVGLRAAIAEPAAQLDVQFEAELVERIASDAEHHLGVTVRAGVVRTGDAALPLVAHVLRGLWDARAGDDGCIDFAEYEALGGVSGALSRSADALLVGLDPRQRQRVRSLLLRMVNLEGDRLTRRELRRIEALALLGSDEAGERLLARLAGAEGPRLIVVRTEAGVGFVDLVHEALIREWDTLRGWIAADQAQLARDEALARRGHSWSAGGRRWRSLPRGHERRELMRGRPGGERAGEQREYQRAMRVAAWSRVGAWVGLIAGIASLVALGLRRIRQVEEARALARAELSETALLGGQIQDQLDSSEARDAIEVAFTSDPARCHWGLVRLLTEPNMVTDDDFEPLLDLGLRCGLLVGEARELMAGAGEPVEFALDPGRSEVWVAHSDGVVERRRLVGGGVERVGALGYRPTRIRLAPGGERVALVVNGQTKLWTRDGTELEGMPGSQPEFSPTGSELVIRKKRAEAVAVHDASDGTERWDESSTKIRALGMSGRRVVFAQQDPDSGQTSLVLRSLPTNRMLGEVSTPAAVYGVAVSAWDPTLVISVDSHGVRRWDLGQASELGDVRAHELTQASEGFVAWSRDGSRVLMSNGDNQISVTDGEFGELWRAPHRWLDRAPPQFSPAGRWFAYPSHVDQLRLWASVGPRPAAGVEQVQLDSFALTDDALVASDTEGSLRTWAVDARSHWRAETPTGRPIRAMISDAEGHALIGDSGGKIYSWTVGAEVPELAYEMEGSIVALAKSRERGVAAVSSVGKLGRWTADGRASEVSLCGGVRRAAFAPDGRSLAFSCDSGELLRVELTPRRTREPVIVAREAPTDQALAWSGAELVVARPGALALHPARGQVESVAASQPRGVAFDDAGRSLVSGGNAGKVQVWSVRGGALVKLVDEGNDLGAFNIESVALSHDGSWYAAGIEEHGQVALYRFGADPLPMLELCPEHDVTTLVFTPDDQRLIAGCSDGSVHAWPLSLAAKITLACDRLARVSPSSDLLETRCPTRTLRP